MAAQLIMKPKKHTASNILYLFLSFPLGLIYFVLLTTGLSLGIGTLIIWIGIPITLLTIAGLWGMAALERELVRGLLHINIPYTSSSRSRSWQEWFRGSLSNSLTWKSLAYVFIKFPLGIVSFTLVVSLLTTALAVTLVPVGYLVNVYVNSLVHSSETVVLIPYFLYADGRFDPIMFLRSFLAVPVGILLWIVSLYLLNGLAWLSGQLAQGMLSSKERVMARPKEERELSQMARA